MHTTMLENRKKIFSIMRYIILHNDKYIINEEINQLEHVV